MSLKSKLIEELEGLSPDKLTLVVEYIRLLQQAEAPPLPFAWKKFIGVISEEDGKEMERIIDEEFNKIEGEW